MEDIKSFQKLLNEFETLPKFKYERTYLDICKHPEMRFEEICSRILAFYFQPKNEHGLGTLFIECIFEVIKPFYENIPSCENIDRDIEIKLEAFAEGKRLDLLLIDRDWVIGIENKIWSNVNNPLDKYKKLIEEYNEENYKILLTLHKIKDIEEMKKMELNGFKEVLYTDFFNILKNKIDPYISDKNTKYIIFLEDFIQTLEHKKGGIIMSKELDAFFRENSKCLDELAKEYHSFKAKKYQKQINKISDIFDKIKKITKNENWNIYENDTLFFKNDNDIGFDSYFEEEDNNPLACFVIVLKSWHGKGWKIFGKQLKEKYKDFNINIHQLTVEIIRQNEEEYIDDNIIEKLLIYYNYIKSLKECDDCINKLE